MLRHFTCLIGLLLVLGSCSPNYENLPAPEGVHLPDRINDPLEPMNRGVWAFNRGMLQGVLAPASKGYRAVVPTQARKSIRNFGYNLAYPGRVLNQLLQGRLGHAGQESKRFLTNSTVGVLGLFDVASKWDMPKHRGNFGQTFHHWGWDGKTFVVLPFLGPSDEAHAVAHGMDRLVDPLTYSGEARQMMYGLYFNKFSENADEALRLMKSDPDAYSKVKYFWTYAAMEKGPDWQTHGPPHAPSLETLAVATLRLQDPGFLDEEQEAKVRIPSTGRKLPFNYWLQKDAAPVVYIVPGLGSHRLTMQVLSVAEGLYERGFSVVTISGIFHPEFIEKASSAQVPGYAKADRRDLLAALSEIDKWLEGKYGERMGSRALVGCSMGGFHALALAAEAAQGSGAGDCGCFDESAGIKIERYLAINAPVDLEYGMQVLDGYQSAPSEWPEEVRQQRINNAAHKVVALMSQPVPEEVGELPFDGVESRYLVGLAFRFTLRDAIYRSERLHQLGLLTQYPSKWSRERVYHEILGLSYSDYLKRIVLPHYGEQGISAEAFNQQVDLKRFASELAQCDHAYMITSRNDFLLSDQDVDWLKLTFGEKRLTLLERGGHLGALSVPLVHDRIAATLESLKHCK